MLMDVFTFFRLLTEGSTVDKNKSNTENTKGRGELTTITNITLHCVQFFSLEREILAVIKASSHQIISSAAVTNNSDQQSASFSALWPFMVVQLYHVDSGRQHWQLLPQFIKNKLNSKQQRY